MIRKLLFAALCLILSAGRVYAAPGETDEYGNVIDWTEDTGGEDMAGNETDDEVQDSPQDPGYSFLEQAEVLKQMESAVSETQVPEETGYLTISIDEPKNWSQGNIRVTLYSGNRKETVWLYRQNGWTASVKLPIGTYTFDIAETSVEEFVSDINTFTIDNDVPASIVLTEGKNMPQVTITTPPTAESEETPDLPAESRIPVAVKIFIGIFTIAGVMWILHLIKRKKTDYRNDLLD